MMLNKTLAAALAPLVAIANAYDANELDDEARKFWGEDLEFENTTPADQIELYQGRGGRQLLTLAHCLVAREALASGDVEMMRDALAPLVMIADAYDDNSLDDEARKFWGVDLENENTTPPEQIELYQGRGGRELLTLADALAARCPGELALAA